MNLIIYCFVVLIAFIHTYIMIFEMFAWETRGPKVFRSIPKELFPQTKVMAANQGLYNGFLAAGLIWSLFLDSPWDHNVALFFLICVFVAGVYGAYSADKKIIYVQSIPALIPIVLILLQRFN